MGTVRNGTTIPYFTPSLTPEDAVYTIWIGWFPSQSSPVFNPKDPAKNRLTPGLACHLQSSNSDISCCLSGTNDLGANAFLTASQVPGKTLPDYISCVFCSLDSLYSLGARKLVLFNLAPLDLAPLYANESYGGVDRTWLWRQKDERVNKTETAEKMREYTRTVNEVFLYQAGFETVVSKRWEGADIVVFDVHRLVSP